jgi:hypothetical protein
MNLQIPIKKEQDDQELSVRDAQAGASTNNAFLCKVNPATQKIKKEVEEASNNTSMDWLPDDEFDVWHFPSIGIRI